MVEIPSKYGLIFYTKSCWTIGVFRLSMDLVNVPSEFAAGKRLFSVLISLAMIVSTDEVVGTVSVFKVGEFLVVESDAV